MKYIKFLFLLGLVYITGCAAYYPPPPFVPYKYYNYPPPLTSGRNNEPTGLRCIDNSNIFVHCNEMWWWGGSARGWIPTGGGMYPWPGQMWPKKVYEVIPSWKLNGIPVPVIPYPY